MAPTVRESSFATRSAPAMTKASIADRSRKFFAYFLSIIRCQMVQNHQQIAASRKLYGRAELFRLIAQTNIVSQGRFVDAENYRGSR
jgi:hypothetical protein